MPVKSAADLMARYSQPIPDNSPESSEPPKIDREKQIENRMEVVPDVMRVYGVPPRFINMTWTLRESLKPYVPATDDARGLYLFGGTGRGKSVTLALVIREWLRAKAKHPETWPTRKALNGAWRFVSFPALVMELQDTFRHEKGDSAHDVLKKIVEVPFLAIDDLGAEKATEFVRQSAYYILDHREKFMRPTFITTNASLERLNDDLDPRISSRIAGCCHVVEMTGRDQRLEGARKS